MSVYSAAVSGQPVQAATTVVRTVPGTMMRISLDGQEFDAQALEGVLAVRSITAGVAPLNSEAAGNGKIKGAEVTKEPESAWKPTLAKLAEYFPSETVMAYTLLIAIAPPGTQRVLWVAIGGLILNAVLFLAYRKRAKLPCLGNGGWQKLGISSLFFSAWALLTWIADAGVANVLPGLNEWIRFFLLFAGVSAALLISVWLDPKVVLPQQGS